MTTTKPKAAAAARIGASLAARKRGELLGLLRPCFVRCEPWLQASKYLGALASDLPRRNGWTIAQRVGDRAPLRTQRLLNRAVWDTCAAMGVVRRFAVAGLDEAARRQGRRRWLAVGALDETSQVKQGTATAGVQRHYLGCVGKVANGITTVHLSYVREQTGHALIGARQWIPAAQIDDPVRSLVMGLPPGLEFRSKGELAIDLCTEAFGDGVRLDFVCGDEVYGACTRLRKFFEDHGQGYVLRVPSTFRLTLAAGVTPTCKQAVTRLLKDTRRWEIRSAGTGSKGQRWYGWAWLATASPRHHLLIRRHLSTGELAFHYCFVPEGQAVSKSRLIRAAGLRWPVEETFEFGKDCFGLDQSRVRLYTGDRPPHRPGHGGISDLRRDRRPAARAHQYPGPAPGQARPAGSRRPGDDPADRPGDRPPAHHPARHTRPHRTLVELAPPPASPRPLVPPARRPRPRPRNYPSQIAIG